MKLCLLYDPTFEPIIPEYFDGYEWELINVERPAYDFLLDLSRRKQYDVYFNFCDGALDEDRPGLDVIEALEMLNLPYTGADGRFYSITREQMQSVADVLGIGFARGFHAKSLRDLSEARSLRYPLMVKHPNSYGSEGMTRESRVETPQQLRTQAERMLDLYGGARVEEFIEGSEYTCLVVDNPEDLANPFAYPPGTVVFPEGETFLHTEVKWIKLARIQRTRSKILAARIQEMSRRLFIGLGGTGYARTDIRMDSKRDLFTLEINPNCAILYDLKDHGPADIPITFDPDGHRGFFDRIFRSAILRQQMRIPITPPRRAVVPVEKARSQKTGYDRS
ncbi:MAG: D-alanine--D-alanine ligase [Anaerolineales bacterium]|nr:D-alanine--D-alanine ligase [Anaerolineales bacterium]